jgi:ribosomal protein S12 methylthiotransferase
LEELIEEAGILVREGARELILVAQDTGEYGVDLYGKRMLSELLRSLDSIDGLHWIRLMYMYPEAIDDDLIDAMVECPKVLEYLDVPFQHVSDRVLSLMHRATCHDDVVETIRRLRERMPDIAIRSGFIAGFPGERDSDVIELVSFLREYRLNRVGVFEYSPEEDTPAFDFPDRVDPMDVYMRKNELMDTQEEISEEILERFVGTRLEVIIDELEVDGIYVARSYMDAPDVDGIVYVYSSAPLTIGEFYDVMITDSMAHDLVASTDTIEPSSDISPLEAQS